MLTDRHWWTRQDLPGWSVRTDYALAGRLGDTTRLILAHGIRDTAGVLAPVVIVWGGKLSVWLRLRAETADSALLAARSIVQTVHDTLGLTVLGERLDADAYALPVPAPRPARVHEATLPRGIRTARRAAEPAPDQRSPLRRGSRDR